MATMAAVDLGASSGRVMVGTLVNGQVKLVEAGRFPNGPVAVPTPAGPRLHWDVLRQWGSITSGLRTAAHKVGPLETIGIDTWAVDYGLLDSAGELVGNPASYRCKRTEGAADKFFQHVPAELMYKRVGLQVQPFNTIFQLLEESADRLAVASNVLLMPDLFGYWLSGRRVAETTNASTTGLLDPLTRRWQRDMVNAMATGFDRHVGALFGELVEPGTIVGPVNTPGLELLDPTGSPTQLVAVGSHDTASAVVAVPAKHENFAYISCGTWSLVGLELDKPILTEDARRANLTNELGVDETVRFIKNVMGLWVLNEAVRMWRMQRVDIDVPTLVRGAAQCEARRTVIDIDDPVFFHRGDMPARIVEAARASDQPEPEGPEQMTRCILDSLALAYRRAIRETARVANRDVGVVHMVGGGVQNELLCQLTADATGLQVIAGPVEGTALGNLVVQARAIGAISGGLKELRRVVRDSSELITYEPIPGAEAAWADVERRLT